MATSASQLAFETDFKDALTALQSGDTARAKRIYSAILAQDGRNASARVNMAAITLEEGRMVEVVEHCTAVLQEDPEHPIAREVLAEANLRMANQAQRPADFAQAAQAIDDAIALAPENRDLAARAAAILGRFATEAERGGAHKDAERYKQRGAALGAQ